MTWEVSSCDLGHSLGFAYSQDTFVLQWLISVLVWHGCGQVRDLGAELS